MKNIFFYRVGKTEHYVFVWWRKTDLKKAAIVKSKLCHTEIAAKKTVKRFLNRNYKIAQPTEGETLEQRYPELFH